MSARKRKSLKHVLVPGPLPLAINGAINFTVTGVPLKIQMSGSGIGWSTDEQGICLRPAETPAYFRLVLVLNSPEYSLVGAQIFHQTAGDPSTQVATLFIPASSDQILELHFLHDIPSGGTTVPYQFFIGVKDSSGNTHWPDPTIAFDPEG